jgi:hypothetical protein
VSFVAITLYVASQRVFIDVIYFVVNQSGNFWIHPRTSLLWNRKITINSKPFIFALGTKIIESIGQDIRCAVGFKSGTLAILLEDDTGSAVDLVCDQLITQSCSTTNSCLEILRFCDVADETEFHNRGDT